MSVNKINFSTGLVRLSFVWWGFCGIVLAGVFLFLAFESRASNRWLGALPATALGAALILHKLTCWLIEGFSSKSVAPVFSRSSLFAGVALTLIAGLLASNWPSPPKIVWDQAPAAAPSALTNPSVKEVNNPAPEKWWEQSPIVGAAPIKTDQELEQIHFATIRQAHPDFQSIASSKNFLDWVSIQNNRAEYERVMQRGNAAEIIEMLSAYKAMLKARPKAAVAPAPSAEENWQRQEALRNLARRGGQLDP